MAGKRRKWWFVGLALLALCIWAWKWSEPQYEFLRGTELWAIETDYMGVAGEGRLAYRSKATFPEMLKKVEIELGRGARAEHSSLWELDGCAVTVEMWPDEQPKRPAPDMRMPPVRHSSDTCVVIYRKPTLSDRIKAWLFAVTGRGTR